MPAPIRFPLGGLLTLLLSGAFVQAGTPAEDLLRLVPEDAGFCIVVQDPRATFARLRESPVLERFLRTRLGRELSQSPAMQKFRDFEDQLRTHLQVSVAQLRDEILGDAAVFVYVPGPPSDPEREEGMLLVQARAPDRLEALIERFTTLQRQSGELLRSEARTHRGLAYQARVKSDRQAEYYARRGEWFAFSDQEARIRAILERWADPARAKTPQFLAMSSDKPLLTWFVNPRAFEPALQSKLSRARAGEAAFLRRFADYWQAIDSLALGVRVEADLELHLRVTARGERLPASAQAFFTAARRPSAIWSGVPADALLVLGSQWPLEPLIQAIGEFLTPEARATLANNATRAASSILGRDVLPVFIRHLGPDWGLVLTPPESGAGPWPAFTALVRLQPGGFESTPIQTRALNALDLMTRLNLVSTHAQSPRPFRLRLEPHDPHDLRILEGGTLPPGMFPCFTWKDGFLVLASSPDALKRFRAPAAARLAEDGVLDAPLLRVDPRGWAGYLRRERSTLGQLASRMTGVPSETIVRDSESWLEWLDLVALVELRQRSTAGQVRWELMLKPREGPLAPDVKKPH